MRAHAVPKTDSDIQLMSEEKTFVERCQVLYKYKEHLTLRELVGTVLLSEHILALLSLELCLGHLQISQRTLDKLTVYVTKLL